SADSSCVLPAYLIGDRQVEEMRRYTQAFAEALGVIGLINVQYAIKDGVVYVLEVNPRASRTVPFVSKATGVPLAKLAAAVMVGRTLDELGLPDDLPLPGVAVKEAVFPFTKLPGVDTILGPEMRSTGEVMGFADSFGMAFAKAQIAADGSLPLEGAILVTVNDSDKPTVVPIVRRFHEMGFRIVATEGTEKYLRARGVPAERVAKVHEGAPDGKPRAGREDVGKAKTAAKAPPKRAPPPAPPPAPKVKFRGRVLENEPLARYTTYRIGGPARYLVLPADADDVIKALDLAQGRGLPWVVLGLGSNLLVKDTRLPGGVIRGGQGLGRVETKGAPANVGARLPAPLLARRP